MEKITYQTISPCYKCESRHSLCHDSCNEYKEFKDKGQQINEARTKYKNAISNIARRAKL